jgi:AcrR family transcriptional regulator
MAQKRLRKDAAERREAILAAAEIAFAEKGLDVPLEEICTAAGVGRATLYRNFENRIALVHAIMSNNLDKLDRIVADTGDSPDGLALFFREILDQQVKTGGLVYLISQNAQLDKDLTRRFLADLDTLVARARAAGRIRQDIETDQVAILVRMMWGGIEGLGFADRRRAAPAVFALALQAMGMDSGSVAVELDP